MLRWRLTLGIAFIATLIGLAWLDGRAATPGVALVPLALLLTWAASGEILRLLSVGSSAPNPAIVYGGNVAIVALGAIAYYLRPSSEPATLLAYPFLGLCAALILAFVGQMRDYRPETATPRIAQTTFALVYVGGLMSCLVQLRFFGPSSVGLLALGSLLLVTKMTDIGAYTVGRLVGRHKLAPRISPGKTIEGAIGGLAFALLSAWWALAWLPPYLFTPTSTRPWWGWIAFGLLVGLAGMLGDLAESMLKRSAGRKDSSDWMPGFGGVLDMIDSLLMAAPVAYGLWLAGIVGP